MNSSRWQDGGDDGNNKYKATEQRGGGAATLGLPVPAVSAFRFEVLKIQRLTLLCSDRTFKKEVNNEEEKEEDEENERGTIVDVVPEMVSDFPVLGFINCRFVLDRSMVKAVYLLRVPETLGGGGMMVVGMISRQTPACRTPLRPTVDVEDVRLASGGLVLVAPGGCSRGGGVRW
ncbi:hypothetical protein QVD17_00576 [Tagetes erecta]|uniref:Uncharacterized protein n=1 Tax=Tagetes erecta TaxID=13708 RepID=A0AAD8P7B9_TARER|nr:hypothetical protein QVD17_00576 [Tagetes erecta]